MGYIKSGRIFIGFKEYVVSCVKCGNEIVVHAPNIKDAAMYFRQQGWIKRKQIKSAKEALWECGCRKDQK